MTDLGIRERPWDTVRDLEPTALSNLSHISKLVFIALIVRPTLNIGQYFFFFFLKSPTQVNACVHSNCYCYNLAVKVLSFPLSLDAYMGAKEVVIVFFFTT